MMTASFDAAGAIAYLNGMLARMSNMQPVLHKIGIRQAAEIQGRILEGKTDPDGKAWEPWKPSTLRERTNKGNAGQGLLWDEGSLVGSLLGSISVHASSDDVSISTSNEHAGFLQDGTPRMVARPFMGWNADDVHYAEFFVINYLEGIINQ